MSIWIYQILPSHFRPTRRLQRLDLHNNTLTALSPGLFSGLDRLIVLNVSRNDIGSKWVTGDTFSPLSNLVALDLSHNQLTVLDGQALSALRSLQVRVDNTQSLAPQEGRHNECLPGFLVRKFIVGKLAMLRII